MAETSLRRVFMTDATGEEDVVLERIPVGKERGQAEHLQQLGKERGGRVLSVRITGLSGEVLADLPAPAQE